MNILELLDRPQLEKDKVALLLTYMANKNRTGMDVSEFCTDWVIENLGEPDLHKFLLAIEQSWAYKGIISYTYAVNLQSVVIG